MNSISNNFWEEIIFNKRVIEKIKNDLDCSELVAKSILLNKFSQLEINSIYKKIETFNPFLKNTDFISGSKIIEKNLKENKKILIIGDYDVDGCISTSLFMNFFKYFKKKVEFYIPNRFKDGYGASLELIKKLTKNKPDLIIMLDCGSNAFEAINYLKSKNIKTLIIDHHEVYKPYLKADCLINPKKECDYHSYNYLCSATLTYFFIDLLIKQMKLNIKFEENLIYVLLATICDIMPLRGINRLLAINTLKNFDLKKNFIFHKIFTFKNLNRPLEIDDLGFLIGPILNSAGRLGDANIIVNLLISNDKKFQEKIISNLIETNEKRKKIQDRILKEIDIFKFVDEKNNVIIQYDKILNEGLIGIIAAKLKEYYNKPSIVLTQSGNIFKASARSTQNFNIGKYIKDCKDQKIILAGGGHNLAAGFSIKKNKIFKFIKFINSKYQKKFVIKSKKFLSKINLSAINKNFYHEINKLSPFGYKNGSPYFLIENIKIIKPKIINNKFVSFHVKSKSGKLIPVISFSMLESNINKNILANKNEISLIVQIKENLWKNKKSLQLILIDLIDFPNKA